MKTYKFPKQILLLLPLLPACLTYSCLKDVSVHFSALPFEK